MSFLQYNTMMVLVLADAVATSEDFDPALVPHIKYVWITPWFNI